MKSKKELARRLRRDSTDAENALWRILRDRQMADVKFRRQHPLGPYVLDFASMEHRLVIELDGGQHTPEIDAERTAFIEARGYRVIRFWNNDVLENIEGVYETIKAELAQPSPDGEGGA